MANGKSYLMIGSSGFPTEEFSITTSAGAADSGKIPALDGSGKLDSTMMPAGLGVDSSTLTAGEALAAGDVVYISAAGTVFKADANAVAKMAVGFVLAAYASGAVNVLVYFEGSITGKSGLTPGASYFLSDTTAGGVITAVVAGAGKIQQFIGKAVNATTITFEAGEPLVRS